MLLVGGYHREVESQGRGGDLNVGVADGSSLGPQVCLNFSVGVGAAMVKLQDNQRGEDILLEPLQPLVGRGGSVSSREQLGHYQNTGELVLSGNGPQPVEIVGIRTATEYLGNGVGVEEVGHCSIKVGKLAMGVLPTTKRVQLLNELLAIIPTTR